MRRLILILSFCLSTSIAAEPWEFEDRIAVSPHYGEKIFHHIESAGRKNIAIAGNTVAAIWEDNHDGSPQVYVAFKPIHSDKFSRPVKVSNGKFAYDPVVVSLGNDKFLMAWEQDDNVWVRDGNKTKLGPPAHMGKGRQVSISKLDAKMAIATWAKPVGVYTQVVVAPLEIKKNRIIVEATQAIDPVTPKNNQIYPVLASTNKGVIIIWEDRRRGHTVLLYSHRDNQGQFSKTRVLNEVVYKSSKYGRGNGVTRPAVSAFGQQQLAATWMDKRAFKTGYDIYAATTRQGKHLFGSNQKVQDIFGDNISQWNPAIAGSAQGDVVVAWDDDRDETSDIWLSRKTNGAWSEDFQIPAASGEGAQSNPAIVFDGQRNLHIIWIDQKQNFAPSQLFYVMAKYHNQ